MRQLMQFGKAGMLALAALAVTCQPASADQGLASRARADNYFRHGAYHQAAAGYQQIADKTPRRKDAVLHARLADCYRLMHRPDSAAAWYAKALSAPRKTTSEMRLHYAEVLMTLEQYDSAAAVLRQYQALAPGNARAVAMAEGCALAGTLRGTAPGGRATLLPLNTDRSEIAPAIAGGKLVYSLDSALTGTGKRDNWTGQGYYNLYRVACPVPGRCDGSLQPVSPKLNTRYHDGTATFSRDQKEMYFTRSTIEKDMLGGINGVADEEGTVSLAIMVADQLDTVSGQYKRIVEAPFNQKNTSTTHPALSPDGTMLVFASDREGGRGGVDLYISRRVAGGAWSQPANLGAQINTSGMELFPVFISDREITFASNGHPGLGGLDVFYAKLDPETGTWGSLRHAGMPVNSSWDDMSLTLYPNRRSGYFSSNRPARRASDNLYAYRSLAPFINLLVEDSLTGLPLSMAEIAIETERGAVAMRTDAGGSAQSALWPQDSYRMTVRRDGFGSLAMPLSALSLTEDSDTMDVRVRLQPNTIMNYRARILDEASGEAIESPLLVITMDGERGADTVNLATGSLLQRHFNAGHVYRINAIKENYYSDEKIVDTRVADPALFRVSLSDTLYMCKLSIGAVCQIENILYDFDKADIRADAMGSLDKVLKLLRENPGLRLQINSHTDCKGGDDYNLRLSAARANTVIRFLAKRGVNVGRLQAKGFGASAPVFNCAGDCEGCSEDGRQRNRRTEFSVLGL